MGFLSKTFKKLKKVVKTGARVGLATATGGASEVLYAAKKASDAQSDALKGIGDALNAPAAQMPDLAMAQTKSALAERKKRRLGRSSGRQSTILAGSTLGNLGAGSFGRHTLLGG